MDAHTSPGYHRNQQPDDIHLKSSDQQQHIQISLPQSVYTTHFETDTHHALQNTVIVKHDTQTQHHIQTLHNFGNRPCHNMSSLTCAAAVEFNMSTSNTSVVSTLERTRLTTSSSIETQSYVQPTDNISEKVIDAETGKDASTSNSVKPPFSYVALIAMAIQVCHSCI